MFQVYSKVLLFCYRLLQGIEYSYLFYTKFLLLIYFVYRCCSPWGRYESDTTEQLDFHFSLSCLGEGNGNPLQCSCLENARDGGAWWAAIYGVAQSRTRLKRLSSSSSSSVVAQTIKILLATQETQV